MFENLTMDELLNEITDKAVMGSAAIDSEIYSAATKYFDEIIDLADFAKESIPELNFDS